MIRLLSVVAALGVLFVAGQVSAQEPGSSRGDLPYTEYFMNEELIEEDLLRPDLDALYAARRPPTTSLIKIRDTFVPELVKAGENL
ncbi:MAG: hypothetical protein JXB32_07880 [Deltaproteobacteria bacterium]|nr:hypothetical protein [Deltaproteobacteria bacterium]